MSQSTVKRIGGSKKQDTQSAFCSTGESYHKVQMRKIKQTRSARIVCARLYVSYLNTKGDKQGKATEKEVESTANVDSELPLRKVLREDACSDVCSGQYVNGM